MPGVREVTREMKSFSAMDPYAANNCFCINEATLFTNQVKSTATFLIGKKLLKMNDHFNKFSLWI